MISLSHRLSRRIVAVVASCATAAGMILPISSAQSAPARAAHSNAPRTAEQMADTTRTSGAENENADSDRQDSSPLSILDRDANYRITVRSRENTLPLRRDDSPKGRCMRDPMASNFQRCRIWSPSNKRYMSIHFKPAVKHSRRVLMLLDGASAIDTHSRWINLGGAARTFANTDINVILPIGGGASYYADFQYPYKYCSLAHLKLDTQQWETFLTKDLLRWATDNDLATSNWSVGGFSMGGGSALALTERHPDIFDQALSYSGLNMMFVPGLQEVLTVTSDLTPCMWRPFGSPLNPARYEFDPFLNMEKLRDAKDVYLSANLGIPAIRNYHSGDAINSFWEWGVVVLTVLFFLKAKAINLTNVTLHIKPLGTHNYWVAAQELRETKERILNKTIDDDDDVNSANIDADSSAAKKNSAGKSSTGSVADGTADGEPDSSADSSDVDGRTPGSAKGAKHGDGTQRDGDTSSTVKEPAPAASSSTKKKPASSSTEKPAASTTAKKSTPAVPSSARQPAPTATSTKKSV